MKDQGRPGLGPEVEIDLSTLFDRDSASAEKQYRELRGQLRRFLEYDCRDPDDAVQEVFVRGFRRIREGVDTTDKGIRAYLFGIARNLIKEEWKPKRRREQQMEPEAWDARVSSDREVERAEAVIELEQCLGSLSPSDRAFILRYAQEGPDGLARDLGRSPQNVRVMAFRIRERLREIREGRVHSTRSGHADQKRAAPLQHKREGDEGTVEEQ
jgi:RNA polymerase sigma-70 factor (ECF subfamily)